LDINPHNPWIVINETNEEHRLENPEPEPEPLEPRLKNLGA
jgi:hypothetical protein